MTTEELLKKCVNKEYAAWDEFARRYRGLVTRSVRYKLNRLNARISGDEFRDVVQEVFLLIWEKDKLKAVKNTVCLKSWLVIVSLNVTSNYCRKKAFRDSAGTLSLDEAPNADLPGLTRGSMVPSLKLNTARTLETNELKDLLEKEIAKLGIRQQLILKLNVYDGKKQKDIAKIMNIPEGTVATTLKRVKDRLRKNLGKILDAEY